MNPQQSLDHQIKVSDRNHDRHMEVVLTSHKSMNSIIFVISTGTLVLSISFIGYIKTYLHHPWILILCWFSLMCSIGFNFYAHILSSNSSIRQIELLNEERKNGFLNGVNFNDVVDKDKKIIKIRKRAKMTNWIVITSLIVGLAALFFFGGINLLAQNAINKDAQDRLNAPIPTIINNYYSTPSKNH